MRKQAFIAAVLAVSVTAALAAQPRAVFEVTSVRLNTSGETRASMQFTPAGDFTAVNQPVRVLLNIAYQIPLFRVEGMPDWFTTERYDVSAKAPDGLSTQPLAEVRGQLLRSLLELRFGLKARLVTKDVGAMIVTVARDGGRLGPRFRPSQVDCDVAIAAARGRGAAPGAPREPVCALGGASGGRPDQGYAATICGRAVTMAQIAQGLSGVYQRPVIDQTGLQGRYDFDLLFTPDSPGGPGIAFGASCGTPPGDRPSLSTAIQEQLGLRIRFGRAPMEVLVIDDAQRPTPN